MADETSAYQAAGIEERMASDAQAACEDPSHAELPFEDVPVLEGQLALDLGPEFEVIPAQEPDYCEDEGLTDDGGDTAGKPCVSTQDKLKGAGQMVAGATLAAVGVPAMIIPIAPSSLMIAGGATLAARGQRTFSGREISEFEEKAEVATEKLTKVTKKATGGLLSRLGEASTRAAQRLSETDWDEKLGLDEE